MAAFVRSFANRMSDFAAAAPLAQAGSSAQERANATPRLGFYNCYSKGYPIVYHGSVPGGNPMTERRNLSRLPRVLSSEGRRAQEGSAGKRFSSMRNQGGAAEALQ
jgi:hypothetical protein